MLGLVDYGSDSESEEAPTTSTASTSVATTTTSSTKPNLILPKASTSSLSLPPPKSTLPTKKSKGPVRILLDLPPPSSSISNTDSKSNDEPVKKKLKFTPGGSSGGGLSGLASMLPAPKYESTSVKLEKALSIVTQPSAGSKEENGEEIKTERTISTAFVPYSLAKGKKPVFKPSVAVVEEVDFFGLGSTASSSSTTATASTSTYITPKSSMSISSAPSVNPTTKSSYGSIPTAEDPYPGFILLPTGQWVAKDQETYDLWVAEHAAQEAELNAVPKGFEEKDILKNGGEMIEVDDSKRSEEWSQIPKVLPRPGSEAVDKPKPTAAVKLAGRAKGKHQLSSLLADAVSNRQELEDRIAQGRASRKSSGAKYGF